MSSFVGHQLLQPPVLTFDLLQAFGVIGFLAAVLGALPVAFGTSRCRSNRSLTGAFSEQVVRLPQLAHDLIPSVCRRLDIVMILLYPHVVGDRLSPQMT